MRLVSSFTAFLQPLAGVMTAPTFANFLTILAGWVFAQRRTVTGMIVAADMAGRKHHSIFHRLFSRARWSRDQLGLAVFDLIEPWLGDAANVVFVALDDTLARKRGRKVFGVGMHHDPMLSTRKKTIINWGHDWVILGIIVRLPFCPTRCFCLPILFRLYLNKAASAKARRVHKTRPELAIEMLTILSKAQKHRRFHAIADSAYGGQSVLNELPENCDLTSRLSMNARVYEAPPPRRRGQRGRPRKRGRQMPSPRQMLTQHASRLELNIYGRHDKARVVDAKARVYAAPQRALRIVAVEPMTGGRRPQAFYSTASEATAEEVLQWYAMRWSIEVTFHDAKQHLGFEQPQGWSRRAVERTAPVAMMLYGLIVLWFAREGHRYYVSPNWPWYAHKPHASFADMLNTLRRESVRQEILQTGLSGRWRRKILKTLNTALQAAA